jgi:hypothetical protein
MYDVGYCNENQKGVRMNRGSWVVICFACVIPVIGTTSSLHGEFSVDIESGMVFSGYNDVQVPKETGTLFSLSEDLSIDPEIFVRLRVSYLFADKHVVSLFAAPLRLNATGEAEVPIMFEGVEFATGSELNGLYRFDSYRVTYSYMFFRKERLRGGFGLTAKIRDAAIRIESGNLVAEKTNTGFVPLLNWYFEWMLAKSMGILFEGDALAAPQGRAEDVFLGVAYKPIPKVTLKTGYRFIEGGADVDEVYNFALLHFIVGGFVATF